MKKELKSQQKHYCPESVDARLRSPFFLPDGTCYPKILSYKQKEKIARKVLVSALFSSFHDQSTSKIAPSILFPCAHVVPALCAYFTPPYRKATKSCSIHEMSNGWCTNSTLHNPDGTRIDDCDLQYTFRSAGSADTGGGSGGGKRRVTSSSSSSRRSVEDSFATNDADPMLLLQNMQGEYGSGGRSDEDPLAPLNACYRLSSRFTPMMKAFPHTQPAATGDRMGVAVSRIPGQRGEELIFQMQFC